MCVQAQREERRAAPMEITVAHKGVSSMVRLSQAASEQLVRETVSAAVGLPVGSFVLRDGDGMITGLAAQSLVDGERYSVEMIPTKCPQDPAVAKAAEGGKNCDGMVNARDSDSKIALASFPVKVPRVVITALGTGEYRQMAIDALESVQKYFGGDCIPSLHLLTDSIEGVDPLFNPRLTPYREWPDSGLLKFHDIKVLWLFFSLFFSVSP